MQTRKKLFVADNSASRGKSQNWVLSTNAYAPVISLFSKEKVFFSKSNFVKLSWKISGSTYFNFQYRIQFR